MERRKGQRRPLSVPVNVANSATPQAGWIRDVCEEGCRVDLPGSTLEVGQQVRIRLVSGIEVTGHVVWSFHNAAGLEFDHRLHPKLVEAFTARLGDRAELPTEINPVAAEG